MINPHAYGNLILPVPTIPGRYLSYTYQVFLSPVISVADPEKFNPYTAFFLNPDPDLYKLLENEVLKSGIKFSYPRTFLYIKVATFLQL